MIDLFTPLSAIPHAETKSYPTVFADRFTLLFVVSLDDEKKFCVLGITRRERLDEWLDAVGAVEDGNDDADRGGGHAFVFPSLEANAAIVSSRRSKKQ